MYIKKNLKMELWKSLILKGQTEEKNPIKEIKEGQLRECGKYTRSWKKILIMRKIVIIIAFNIY